MPPPPVVTVGHLLRGRADAYGLGGPAELTGPVGRPYLELFGSERVEGWTVLGHDPSQWWRE